MKASILFTIFIFIQTVSLSKSDYCQCQCCTKEPGNDDCQVNTIGNATIDNCPADDLTTVCTGKCKQQYPTQCNQADSIAEGLCLMDSKTTMIPPTTTILNGPVQCKCSCCVGVPCSAVHQGDIIVEKCDLCQKECTDKYLSQCTQRSASIIAECGPAPAGSTSRLNFNITLLFIFIFVKEFFL
ncbi:hypothetical protein I4U23_030025 [Adineta vaga]|nr:hypothetical protein I4U23_030025 [Adineta vaga]